MEKPKQSSSEQQKEELAPVKVEDMSETGDGTPNDKEPIFQITSNKDGKENQGEDDNVKVAEPEENKEAAGGEPQTAESTTVS